MNPQHSQHQRQNSIGSAYPQPPQMNPSASAPFYQQQQQQQRQQFPPYQQQHQEQQQQQQQQQQQVMHPPIYPMLSFMTHAPPPLQHHHDPSMAHHQPMQQAHMHLLHSFWMRQMHEIQNVPQDFKVHHLPLARIKKVMKTDDDVKAKMISADAPMIFDKGCDIFITELTLRAWIHAEENKRRTLQRSDIAAAIAKTDMFDFLIDIVPREEYKMSLPKEHKPHHDLTGPDRRRSQEIFQPLPGPAGATGPRRPNNGAGIGGGMDTTNVALDNYSYPFGILDQGDFTLATNAPEIIDPYQQSQQSQQQQQQLQAQYMARQSQQFQ